MTFLAAVKHHCEGLTIAVGCLGEQCKYAIQEPDSREVRDAAEYLLLEVDTSNEPQQVADLIEELRQAVENRDPDHQCEASFSSSQCDSCGSTLGGNREAAYGLVIEDQDAEPIHMSICTDCVMFHATGNVPEGG